MKQTAHLENWLEGVHYGANVLTGIVSGHPKIPNGKRILTSPIIKIDREAKTAETRNTFYTLGKKQGYEEGDPSCSMEKI